MFVVAVDGPSAAGKSTAARGVADARGLRYLDTGSMYRAVTWAVLDRGVDPDDADGCSAVARGVSLEVTGPGRIAVDGRDVSAEIRGADVTAAVSAVSRHPDLRHHLRGLQREWVGDSDAIVEGRDIGTVVFPDARLKVYLVADATERAGRRRAEADEAAGSDIARRDSADTDPASGRLVVAPDAVVIDTTGRSPDDVIAEVLSLVDERAG